MNLQEAEEYYKKYLGQGFHMCREEPGKYDVFKKLELPQKYFIQWDKELLDSEFEKMRLEKGRMWVHHVNILTILFRRRCDTEAGTVRLLDEMEKMEVPGLLTCTLMIENMAGRTASLKDGGCYFICTYTGQTSRMKRILEERFFSEGSKDIRYNAAVLRCRNAMRRFERH